jgi:hypothetical protein
VSDVPPPPRDGAAHTARIRQIAQSQVLWLAALVIAVAPTSAGFGVWVYSIQSSQEQQQQVLERVVAFMDEQTRFRRAAGARERLRKELCTAGALPEERCLFLASDSEIAAMER